MSLCCHPPFRIQEMHFDSRVGVVGSIKLLRVAVEKVNSKPLLIVLKLSCTVVSPANKIDGGNLNSPHYLCAVGLGIGGCRGCLVLFGMVPVVSSQFPVDSTFHCIVVACILHD